MKINLSDYDFSDFLIRDGVICTVPAKLITPNHIGAKFTQQNKIFRSSIWSFDGCLLSAGFYKFVNFLENPENFPVPLTIDNCVFVEKIDGCCDENTILITESGRKKIKEICETKYSGKVLGYDHKTNKQIFTKIISHSIQTNNNDWYELELENGIKIKLTGNHQVWLPQLNCYRRVDELSGNEEILLKK